MNYNPPNYFDEAHDIEASTEAPVDDMWTPPHPRKPRNNSEDEGDSRQEKMEQTQTNNNNKNDVLFAGIVLICFNTMYPDR